MQTNHYASLEALRAGAQRPARLDANEDARQSSAHCRGSAPEWYGLGREGTAGTLAQIVREGWPEGRASAHQLAAQLTAPVLRPRRRRRVWADTGDSIDMQRMYSGQLDRAWQRTRREAQGMPPALTLVVPVHAPAVVGADALVWRAAAALAVVQAWTAAGYSVAVVAAARGKYSAADHDDTREYATNVAVKPARARLDPSALVASMHPGVFRSWMIAEAIAAAPIGLRPGVASVVGVTLEGRPAGAVLLPMVEDRSTAQRAVTDILKRNAE